MSNCIFIEKNFSSPGSKEMKMAEEQDNKFCEALQLEINGKGDFKNKSYWHCRLTVAKTRIKVGAASPKDIGFNQEINNSIIRILAKISETSDHPLIKITQKIEARQHKKCLDMGFVFDTTNQVKIDDYYSCRRALIEDTQNIPPFYNADYIPYPTKSYNLPLVIDARIDSKVKKYKDAEIENPSCMQFYNQADDYKKCLKRIENSKSCLTQIDKKKFKKEMEEKISCQKRSYLQFPDEFLKGDIASKEAIKKAKNNSDYYNKNNFASIGIDSLSKFDADAKRVKEVEVAKKNANSKNGIYSKLELTKLRQQYVEMCQKDADFIMTQYIHSLKNDCEALK